MKWKHPPVIKIYEALGSIADDRVEVTGNTAKIFSSSGNKFYQVRYDSATEAIMVNDNGSYYQSYLGYPAIAYLMLIGELPYTPAVAEKLKGIAWKDINQRFKNDFDKTLEFILADKSATERREIEAEIGKIDEQLQAKPYNLLGPKKKPPEGY